MGLFTNAGVSGLAMLANPAGMATLAPMAGLSILQGIAGGIAQKNAVQQEIDNIGMTIDSLREAQSATLKKGDVLKQNLTESFSQQVDSLGMTTDFEGQAINRGFDTLASHSGLAHSSIDVGRTNKLRDTTMKYIAKYNADKLNYQNQREAIEYQTQEQYQTLQDQIGIAQRRLENLQSMGFWDFFL